MSVVKKVVIGVLGLGAVGGGGYFLSQMDFTSSGPSGIAGLAERIPGDATGMVAVNGLENLLKSLGIYGGDGRLSNELVDVLGEDFEEGLEQAKDLLGIQFSNLSSLHEAGFDFNAAAGCSLYLDSDSDGLVACFLPNSDPDAFLEEFEDLLEEWGGEMGYEVDVTHKDRDGTQVSIWQDIAWMGHDGYLVIASADEERQSRRFLEDVLEGEFSSLAEADWFQGADVLSRDPWQLLLAVNPDLPRGLRQELERNFHGQESLVLEPLEDLLGLAFSADLTPGAVSIRAWTAYEEGSGSANLLDGQESKDRLSKSIPGKAMIAMRTVINIPGWLDLLQSNDVWENELDELFREVRKDTPIDLEEDVLAFLGSPLSFAVFPDRRQGDMPIGWALWIPLLPDHSMADVLEDLFDFAEDEGADVDKDSRGDHTWYAVEDDDGEVGVGMADDHLVVAFGAGTYDVISKALAEPDGTYLDHIEDPDVRARLAGRGDSMAYIDVSEFVELFDDMRDSDESNWEEDMAFSALEGLSDLTFHQEQDGTTAVFKATLSANTDRGLVELVADLGSQAMERQRLDAVRADGMNMVMQIHAAEIAYHSAYDDFIAASPHPTRVPDESRAEWGEGNPGFVALEWVPEGKVGCQVGVTVVPGERICENSCQYAFDRECDEPRYCAYGTDCYDCGPRGSPSTFTVTARCDADGDGEEAVIQISQANDEYWPTLLTAPDVY